jgi:hypothetical protein
MIDALQPRVRNSRIIANSGRDDRVRHEESIEEDPVFEYIVR